MTPTKASKMPLPKKIIIGVWLIVAANLLLPTPDWLDQLLKVLGIFLAVAHVIECFMFSRKIKANHTPAYKGYLLVLIFGVLHLNTLPDFNQ